MKCCVTNDKFTNLQEETVFIYKKSLFVHLKAQKERSHLCLWIELWVRAELWKLRGVSSTDEGNYNLNYRLIYTCLADVLGDMEIRYSCALYRGLENRIHQWLRGSAQNLK